MIAIIVIVINMHIIIILKIRVRFQVPNIVRYPYKKDPKRDPSLENYPDRTPIGTMIEAS